MSGWCSRTGGWLVQPITHMIHDVAGAACGSNTYTHVFDVMLFQSVFSAPKRNIIQNLMFARWGLVHPVANWLVQPAAAAQSKVSRDEGPHRPPRIAVRHQGLGCRNPWARCMRYLPSLASMRFLSCSYMVPSGWRKNVCPSSLCFRAASVSTGSVGPAGAYGSE